ncbi:hypothetical protein ABIF86_004325 [Bradyrhizobium japonicum]
MTGAAPGPLSSAVTARAAGTRWEKASHARLPADAALKVPS